MGNIFYAGALICIGLTVLSLRGWSTQSFRNTQYSFMTKIEKTDPNRKILIITQSSANMLTALAFFTFGLYREIQSIRLLILSICFVTAIVVLSVISAFLIKAKGKL